MKPFFLEHFTSKGFLNIIEFGRGEEEKTLMEEDNRRGFKEHDANWQKTMKETARKN